MPSTSGPGGAQRKGRSAGGRVTAKSGSSSGARIGRPKSAEEKGRYTPPTPKSVRRSPGWFGALALVLLLAGVLLIIFNYLSVLPTVSAWYLLIGLVMIFAGFMMFTRYR